MAAFRGRHVSPAKHSYALLPRKCDYQSVTTGQTDAGKSDPSVPLCFAGDTKITDKQMDGQMDDLNTLWPRRIFHTHTKYRLL